MTPFLSFLMTLCPLMSLWALRRWSEPHHFLHTPQDWLRGPCPVLLGCWQAGATLHLQQVPPSFENLEESPDLDQLSLTLDPIRGVSRLLLGCLALLSDLEWPLNPAHGGLCLQRQCPLKGMGGLCSHPEMQQGLVCTSNTFPLCSPLIKGYWPPGIARHLSGPGKDARILGWVPPPSPSGR